VSFQSFYVKDKKGMRLFMNNPLDTQKDYQEYVNQKSPNSPIFKNCINAFLIGGLICSIGQIIFSFCKYKGLDETSSGTIVSITLIAISAFLTALNIFNKIGKIAGARISSSNNRFCQLYCCSCHGI
jgi:siderophore synthetase component